MSFSSAQWQSLESFALIVITNTNNYLSNIFNAYLEAYAYTDYQTHHQEIIAEIIVLELSRIERLLELQEETPCAGIIMAFMSYAAEEYGLDINVVNERFTLAPAEYGQDKQAAFTQFASHLEKACGDAAFTHLNHTRLLEQYNLFERILKEVFLEEESFFTLDGTAIGLRVSLALAAYDS